MSATVDNVQTDNITAPQGPHYLDIDGALAEIRSLGFDTTMPRLRGWIRDQKLPFFKQGKRLYIERSELQMHFRALQTAARQRVRAKQHDGDQTHLGEGRGRKA